MVKNPRTLEGWFMRNAKPGDEMISLKPAKDITAIATAYKVAVTTERMILVNNHGDQLHAKRGTKVTIL